MQNATGLVGALHHGQLRLLLLENIPRYLCFLHSISVLEEPHWPRKVRYLWPALALLFLLQALMHFVDTCKEESPHTYTLVVKCLIHLNWSAYNGLDR